MDWELEQASRRVRIARDFAKKTEDPAARGAIEEIARVVEAFIAMFDDVQDNLPDKR